MRDTSVILLARFQDSAALPQEPLVAAVTLAELSVGPLIARDEAGRAARQAHLNQAESGLRAAPVRCSSGASVQPRNSIIAPRPAADRKPAPTTR